MSLDSKIERLNKRYRGLARVTSAINDLYIYGIYESNFPKLMETLLNSHSKHSKVASTKKNSNLRFFVFGSLFGVITMMIFRVF